MDLLLAAAVAAVAAVLLIWLARYLSQAVVAAAVAVAVLLPGQRALRERRRGVLLLTEQSALPVPLLRQARAVVVAVARPAPFLLLVARGVRVAVQA
jgi:hypothetical protein